MSNRRKGSHIKNCPKHGRYEYDGGRCPDCCWEDVERSQMRDLFDKLNMMWVISNEQ